MASSGQMLPRLCERSQFRMQPRRLFLQTVVHVSTRKGVHFVCVISLSI